MSGQLGQAVNIAEQLEQARDVARRLFAYDYARRVQPWRELVSELAQAWGCRPIEVPPRLEREGSMPENPLLLFAAVVDLTLERAT